MRTRRFTAAGLAALALLFGSVAGCTTPGPGPGPVDPGPGPVDPGTGGTQKGPDPTDASISATRGPFAIANFSVPRSMSYGGGTVWYPTQPGVYGGVAVVPGFSALESSIRWYGPRLASQGFVVITIDTLTVADLPQARAPQLQAALRTITSDPRVAAKVDPTRLALMGWSMGGGGALTAASNNPNVKAVIPLAPWHTDTSWRNLQTPTLVVQCSADTIAPNGIHSNPIYSSLGGEKAMFMIGGSHFCVTTPDTAVAKMSISWLKRFLDNDTRYSPFICRGPGFGASAFKSSCPV